MSSKRPGVVAGHPGPCLDEYRSYTWRAMCTRPKAGEPIPLSARARARWSTANIVLRGVRAVDLPFAASGGRALFLDTPMQRYFRDVHAMRTP